MEKEIRSGQTIFLKLGGSLITDKTRVEIVRGAVLGRVAEEISRGVHNNPQITFLLGHGSGSFGHVPAAKYGTRGGVQTEQQWYGFTEVGRVASKLNSLVRAQLAAEGLRVISLPPSASAICRDGEIIQLSIDPVLHALKVGLIPLVYGDIAFDKQRGGTIISTEEILGYFSKILKPSWFLLAGETEGVLDDKGQVIPVISADNFEKIRPMLGGSRGTDVTGGMASKVESMLNLVKNQPDLRIRVFSGLVPGAIERALIGEMEIGGTIIRSSTKLGEN